MTHEGSKAVGSWPNGYGKGSFVQTVTCSCGEIFTAGDTNDYYDLDVAERARYEWRKHAKPFVVADLTAELLLLPHRLTIARGLIEAELRTWT